eukprot:GILK01001345.1.p1 GENE.GILK01001345.1~~GILK01001345.1.p1  ORF type:complete len:395 (-),score=42.11 GILK01001345.1:186-1370(-)
MRFSVLSLVVCAWCIASTLAEINWKYYHTTEHFNSEILRLSTQCNGAMTLESRGTPAISVVRIGNNDVKPADMKQRIMILFGEHARELISSESALHLMYALCGENADLADWGRRVLAHSTFLIIPDGNPMSRLQVEQGDYCLRTNENGVDLNRNWDDHWQAATVAGVGAPETNSGSAPFSEPETRIFQQLAREYMPKVFLTIHSGTLGMYTPHAYDTKLAVFNEGPMLDVLKKLNPKYCNCPAGAAGKEVGYLCPGTCLDYVYDVLGVPFAFAWEIYSRDQAVMKQLWNMQGNAQAMIQLGAMQKISALSKRAAARQLNKQHSCFLNKRAKSRSSMDNDSCFTFFNPESQDDYISTVNNWVRAYLEMADLTASAPGIRANGFNPDLTPDPNLRH